MELAHDPGCTASGADGQAYPCDCGLEDRQKAWCQWFTPPAVAEAFLAWSGVEDHHIVLEPAAGEGALCPNRERVVAFERDPELVAELRYWRPQADVVCHNFLDMKPPERQLVDVAVANPPYSEYGEATFIRQALLWAPRVTALIRTVAFNGTNRYELCWRHVRPTRVAFLIHRPQYLGPGGTPTKFGPKADYMAVECVQRGGPLVTEPLPADGRGWALDAKVEWVNWR